MLPFTPQAYEADDPDRTGLSGVAEAGGRAAEPHDLGVGIASGADHALPSELRPRRSLRQESNPHLGRTKGACLPLTLRRR